MIQLDIKEKCKDCTEFTVDQSCERIFANEGVVGIRVTIFCKHRYLCDRIEEQINKTKQRILKPK